MLKRKVTRRRRRRRSRYDRKAQSGLGKAGLYLGAIAALSFLAIVIYLVFLSIRHSGKTDGIFDVIGEMILYLISMPGLLIAYTCRFWSASNRLSPATRFARAALCGFLFPIMVILLRLIVWSVVTGLHCRDSLDDFNVTVVALIFSFVLGIPLGSIGVRRSTPDKP